MTSKLWYDILKVGIAMGIVTVITSGKGGAGKSTVTAGLGFALAKLNRKVVLMDGDAGLRSLDFMLGITERTVYDMSDIFAGNCEPIRAAYASPLCENISVIPAPSSLDKMCSPDDMRRLCGGFARYYDHVLVDCPAGIGHGFECAVAGANRALVVSTPDMVCARDAQIVGTLLEKRNVPARLIINRLRPDVVLSGKMPDIDEIIDIAGLQIIGVVPEDQQVTIANANGRPLPADSYAAVCFDNIARRHLGEYIALARLEKMF